MPAITAVTQDTWPPRVLVSVTGLTVGDGVDLYRVVAGRRTLVRAGAATVGDTSFLRTDAELPFGVPVSWVAVVNDSAEYATTPVTYALPGGKVAVSDAITGDAAETVILAWPEKPRDRDRTVFWAGGRTVVVSGPMGMFTGDVEFFCDSTAARDGLMDVLADATQGVVQIRQPGGYDGVDSYVAVLGLNERRFSQDGTDPRRIIVAQVAETEGWAPALEARGTTLQDVANAYDVMGSLLNANPYFETNVANWTALGGTGARSTAQSHEGVASLLLTPDGVSTQARVFTEEVPAAPGRTFRVSAWVRCAVARSVEIRALWNDAAHVNMSLSQKAVSVAANTWTLLDGSFTAPAGTVFAQLQVWMGSTPAASHLLYVDEATIRRDVLTLTDLSNDYPTLLDLAQGEFA